jgi:hypothetical protein
MIWSNYIADNAKQAKVWTIADSSFFLDFPNFQNKKISYKIEMMNVYKISNNEVDVPINECIKTFSNEKYRCLISK